jgi:hypothetical protein
LHVIDPVDAGPDFRAADVEISLEPKRIGGLSQARLAGESDPLPTRNDGGRLTFGVCPDPVASIVLY